MKHEDIERLLADEKTITPSQGFESAVMRAVEREAAAPRPSAFPWLRALPGLLATAVALIVSVAFGIGSLTDPDAVAVFEEQLGQLTALAMAAGLQWVLLAGLVTLVTVMLPMTLMHTRHNAFAGLSIDGSGTAG